MSDLYEDDYADRMADAEFELWMKEQNDHRAHVDAYITHLLVEGLL
jgi:hypothetical protein